MFFYSNSNNESVKKIIEFQNVINEIVITKNVSFICNLLINFEISFNKGKGKS